MTDFKPTTFYTVVEKIPHGGYDDEEYVEHLFTTQEAAQKWYLEMSELNQGSTYICHYYDGRPLTTTLNIHN